MAVTADRLGELTAAGVATWLDDLSRARLATGSLAGLVDNCHVVGVTSNPTIFQKAIVGSDHYDRQIHDLAVRGTIAGLPAITRCLSEAISINVTLIFSRRRCAEIMDAFLDGIEQARAAGRDLTRVDLVTSGVVNTTPEAALHAVADHGDVRRDTVRPGYHDAAEVMAALAEIGVDADDVDRLERDGLTTFQTSWAALTETVEHELAAADRGTVYVHRIALAPGY